MPRRRQALFYARAQALVYEWASMQRVLIAFYSDKHSYRAGRMQL